MRMAALRRAPYRRHPVPTVPGHHHPAVVHVRRRTAPASPNALVAADVVPALDEHVRDARHVEAEAPAVAPVAPAAPAVAAPVARGAGPGVRVQVQPDAAAGVERGRERGAARVQVEPARAAVVDEAGDVAAARVAVARRPGRPREEGEGAARVERVPERRRRRRRERERALPVQVVVAARVRAAEARADAHLAAPVAPEWRVVVLQRRRCCRWLKCATSPYLIAAAGKRPALERAPGRVPPS